MRTNKKRAVFQVLFQVLCIAIGLVVVAPILYAISVSFMDSDQILNTELSLLPRRIQFENYKIALSTTPLMRYMWNSLVIAGTSSAIRAITASMAAFAFAFLTFRGKNVIFMLFMSTIMVPADCLLVTNYQTVSRLGLVNTYVGMMIVFCASALNILMMRQNFLSFSSELYDAANVDGCGNFRFFTRILLPLNKSVMTTVFISAFIGTWNTYLWPMLVTNKNEMRTVQVGITMLNFPDGTVYGPIMAAATIVLVPTILVFIIFKKQIVSGIMVGSVKG